MSYTGWVVFHVFILGMILLDLYLYEGGSTEKQWWYAFYWTLLWVMMGIAFGGIIYYWYGYSTLIDYYTGYALEKSLSLDNVFVFLLVFAHFGIPQENQHRVLFWGVMGALVLRLVFIVLGIALLEQFEWLFYVFGLFLIYSAFKMLLTDEEERERELEDSYLVELVQRYFPLTDNLHGNSFFIRRNGKWYITPLVIVLIIVELSDVMFALDSVPAILSITRETFVVYSSNAFAILGLRALYFMLAGMVERFEYLDDGIAIILGFVGLKMVAHDFIHIPNILSLAVILGILTISIITSWYLSYRKRRTASQ